MVKTLKYKLLTGINMYKRMKKLGLTEKTLKDTMHLMRNNVDPASMLEGSPVNGMVSLDALLPYKKNVGKLYKLFVQLGFYNLTSTKMQPGMYNFTCKGRFGDIQTFELSHEVAGTFKLATLSALEYFRDNVTKMDMNFDSNGNPVFDQNADISPELRELAASLVAGTRAREAAELEIDSVVSDIVVPDGSLAITDDSEHTLVGS